VTVGTVERTSLLGDASAVFSACERFRYRLTRQWEPDGPTVAFVMLNPSTADEMVADPTVRRCIGFAKREGAGRLVVVNLYALRSTDPAALARADDPIGPDNDEHIRQAARDASLVVAAWGAHPFAGDRATDVAAMLNGIGRPLYRLGPPTKDGHPRHPLYLPADAPLERW
jgi:hypothetical protein